MYANWTPSDLIVAQLRLPCQLETSHPGGSARFTSTGSLSLSGAGAPATPSDRDRVAKAMIWRRDRMLEEMLGEILDSHLAIYAKSASPSPHRPPRSTMCFVWSRRKNLASGLTGARGCTSPVLRLPRSVVVHPVR